jgi:hypothetical protein
MARRFGSGSSGSRKFRISHLFHKSNSHMKLSSYSSANGDVYEMADPLGGPQVNVGVGADSFDMRKYKRGADSPSIMKSDNDGCFENYDNRYYQWVYHKIFPEGK